MLSTTRDLGGLVGQALPVPASGSDTDDTRLPGRERSLDAGREMSSNPPRVISMVLYRVGHSLPTQQPQPERLRDTASATTAAVQLSATLPLGSMGVVAELLCVRPCDYESVFKTKLKLKSRPSQS